jgi:Rrf2 family transcriptional regulator, iron-sulfur cluster assembly transcription factor
MLVNPRVVLCLSQTTGYAIRALSCLHQQSCRAQLIRDIAKCAGIPKPYLARIINKLTHQGLVVAKRGYSGGIALARRAEEISLLQIVEAVEGPDWISPCLLNMEGCGHPQACPTRKVWQRVSLQIRAALKKATLADLMALQKGMKSTRRRGCRN